LIALGGAHVSSERYDSSPLFPLTNTLFIAINTIIFLYQTTLSPGEVINLFQTYGFIPARMEWLIPGAYVSIFTSMFLHGGWIHFLSNIWILFIFGDNVEDRVGSGRYFFFYLLGGVAAASLQYAVIPDSQVPAIGASGAIAAVLGAYFFFFPRARVIALVPIFILPWFFEVPAVVFLGFWFIAHFFGSAHPHRGNHCSGRWYCLVGTHRWFLVRITDGASV
jgi:membrane associated rhomboid family serine protease